MLIFCFFVFLFFFIGLVRSSLLSLLVLVFGFVIASFLIFFFNAEFLALTYIVVYIGSISMLFLFLIIIIDLRTVSELFREVWALNSFFIILLFIFFINFSFFYLESNFFYSFSYSKLVFFDWSRVVYSEQNIVSFAELLFNYFSSQIFLTAICLFIGIIGPLMIFMRDDDHS
jgi:NADH-ubiquinone oxidoreductase chain 6